MNLDNEGNGPFVLFAYKLHKTQAKRTDKMAKPRRRMVQFECVAATGFGTLPLWRQWLRTNTRKKERKKERKKKRKKNEERSNSPASQKDQKRITMMATNGEQHALGLDADPICFGKCRCHTLPLRQRAAQSSVTAVQKQERVAGKIKTRKSAGEN